MAPLKFAAIALAVACATPAHAESVATWQPFIREASLLFGIPSEWIERVMRAESGGNTQWNGRPIRSSAGAMGLMQLMPATWADMRMRLGLGSNPDDPRDNILAGTFYLRLMYDRFGYPGMFAAYNAGPGRYAEHLSRRRALPTETVGYLAAVAPSPAKSTIMTVRPAPQQSIFAVRRNVPNTSSDKPSSTLFVALSSADGQ
ncbi:lytic transglycosylase domain-containing protein [uncultured Novosphingobium sp.]|uniref:lytic transglycosylase domain-containing protein n=1 Tax=uncultured Novosphingobium sp. TaxID=292277 RepID=UPI00258260C6|nr:lytic transglycosylase domain-containing protein [uncultured Novosphingobium sp.]